ncbi:hypothetical protein ACFXCR_06425, partial [Streptomyces sp. NPDC059431]|uniref:hypothetical protein n=1 Tax=Streptomyces sp. NPDC059431 TaxID=3346828 RepID=UPI0036815A6D
MLIRPRRSGRRSGGGGAGPAGGAGARWGPRGAGRGAPGEAVESVVTGLETFGKPMESAEAGDN